MAAWSFAAASYKAVWPDCGGRGRERWLFLAREFIRLTQDMAATSAPAAISI